MFIHNFKYSLKTLLNNKSLIFWTFAFPLILATLFNMAFSNIEKSEKLDIIPIAIVKTEEFDNNQIIKSTFENLSDKENKDRLFDTQYLEEKDATDLLNKGKITGILKIEDNKPLLIFNKSGINQTILKSVTDEIMYTSKIVENLKEYEDNYESIYNKINDITNNVKLNNISNSKLSYTMIEFYSLIAMACLYGAMLSMTSINQVLANMSSKGKRCEISPTKKITMILSSLLASYIVQIIGLVILFIYMILALKIDFGNNILLIILLSLIGSLSGLTLGVFVGTVFKTNENAKTGILISITMLGCYLSGMMGITMKYIIDKNVPIINKLNPVNMITDGFYSLYYYSTLDRYWFNIISLLVFSILLIIISLISLRRQKYDSI